MPVNWTDQAVNILLDGLQKQECLWNLRSPHYKDKGMKKTALVELFETLKSEISDFEADIEAVKSKIQSLRTSFREELRKVKKSQGTGSGVADIYIPKWKYFDSCKFLECVVAVESTDTVTNVSNSKEEEDNEEQFQDQDSSSGRETPKSQKPQKRRRESTPVSNSWMDTASDALKTLAKSSSETTDEWDDFGKDVANTLRGISNKSTQRRAKFAIQKALFDATENSDTFMAPSQTPVQLHAVNPPPSQWMSPNFPNNNPGAYTTSSPVKYVQLGGPWQN